MEFVTNRQWDSYARRVERFNLRRYHSTPTATSIAARANHLIIEVQPDRKGMFVKLGWREVMRGDSPVLGMLDILREPADSDNVQSHGYDDELQVIQIEFLDGSIYEYYDRPLSVWCDYLAAVSKGSFVADNLTPQGKYRKVGQP